MTSPTLSECVARLVALGLDPTLADDAAAVLVDFKGGVASIPEAATYVGTTKGTLWRAAIDGRVLTVKPPPGRPPLYRIPFAELARLKTLLSDDPRGLIRRPRQ